MRTYLHTARIVIRIIRESVRMVNNAFNRNNKPVAADKTQKPHFSVKPIGVLETK